MRYRKERAEVICRELLKLSVIQSKPIETWKYKDGLFWSTAEADSSSAAWREFDTKTDRWSGKDKNSWFTAEIKVPESFDGKPLSLLFQTQAEGWDAKNPQFLVFVNGNATCALDVNHRDVLLSEQAKAGYIYRIDLQAYTGTETDELKFTSKIAEISPLVTKLYYDLIVPLEILSRHKINEKPRVDLELAVEKTINAIDLRVPYSEDFFSSVEKALEIIKEEVYTKLAGYDEVIATAVGHTHIDVAWWWTVAQTRQKTVRSFATFLKYMDEYPDFIFSSSQPQLYKFIAEHAPDLYKQIKERVAEGRWEAEGGMWLEADCNLTSGESLIRQFLYGKRFFKEEFGIDSKILWLPDVFGYSAALPQIMKLCGVDYFMTTKLSWNQWNRMPYDTFIWRGIDGSEVFTHMITTTGREAPLDTFYTAYNGSLHPSDVIGAWERYQQKELNNDVLVSYGYGDGGGGPTREMIEMGIRLSHGIKGAPKVRFANSKQYFDELYEKVQGKKGLPRWVGELYFEYHRGTYTSMARNKRSNRKCEILLQDLEFVSVLAELQATSGSCGTASSHKYPETELRAMWENLLLNQFHDILPGTAIKEVYDVTKVEYEELWQKANTLLNERLPIVAAVAGDLAVVNTLSFERDDIVILPADFETVGLSLNDRPVFCQKTHDGRTIAFINGIPAKGVLGLHTAKTAFDNPGMLPISTNGLKIDTPFYLAEFDDKGYISRLFHKKSNREVLCGDIKNELRVYEDRPMKWDNWDIEIYYTEKSWLVDDTTRIEWLERGPVRATLLVERRFLQSTIIQKIHFYADMPRIDFETWVNWKQSQLLLKARFQTDIKSPTAAYDIQFGNVIRPTHTNTSWDIARFETCAHKWADLSEGGYGVSILNDCKYGHAIHDGVIMLTLVKSGISPYPETDQEEHFFTYSLLPHTGSWREGGTVKAAHSLNTPLYTLETQLRCSIALNLAGKAGGKVLPVSFSFIKTDSPNIMIETIKRGEERNSVIVRMYEFENTRTKADFTLFKKAAAIYEVDCLENRLDKIAENADIFTVEIKPFEIKTLELEF